LQVKGFTKSHLGRGGVMGNLAKMMPSDFWDRGAQDSVTFMLSWKMVRSIATVGVLFQKVRLEFSTWKIEYLRLQTLLSCTSHCNFSTSCHNQSQVFISSHNSSSPPHIPASALPSRADLGKGCLFNIRSSTSFLHFHH
jgi:hypothetical protein